jgi:hypothetical protein
MRAFWQKADESVAQRPHSVEHEEEIMQLRKHLADYSVKVKWQVLLTLFG